MKSKIFAIFLGLFWGINLGFASELDPIFRQNFSNILDEFCHSKVKYPLPETVEQEREPTFNFDARKAEFHETINCIFTDGFGNLPAHVHQKVEPHFRGESFPLESESPDLSACEGKTLAEIVQAQKNTPDQKLGFQTACSFAGPEFRDKESENFSFQNLSDHEYDSVKSLYSACVLGEAVWNEFCAYDRYLWAKERDTVSDLLEQKNEGNLSNSFSAREKKWREKKDFYAAEREKTKKAIAATLQLYQNYEQNYHLHSWFEVLGDGIWRSRSDLKTLKNQVRIWANHLPGRSTDVGYCSP